MAIELIKSNKSVELSAQKVDLSNYATIEYVNELVSNNGGASEQWEDISVNDIEDVVLAELDCNFNDYKKVAIIFDGFGTKTVGRINTHFGYDSTSTTKQMIQSITTTDDKRYGYILIDTLLGNIISTENLNWAQSSGNLRTTLDSAAIYNFVNATKIIVLTIDSAGGGYNPSSSNTMTGRIKLRGVRK